MKLITEIRIVTEIYEHEKEMTLAHLKDENYMYALKAGIAHELMREDGRDETIDFKFRVEGE